MKQNHSLWTALLVSMVLCSPANAQFTLTHEVDPATRRILRQFPQELQNKLLGLVQKALPLIDESVGKYLDELDQIIFSAVAQATCGGIGVAEHFALTIGPFSSTEDPVKKTREHMQGVRQAIRKDSSPDHIAVTYADFINAAAVTYCRMGHEVPKAEIATIISDASARWMAWAGLREQCSSVIQCFEVRYAEVRNSIDDADDRDVIASNADDLFALIPPLQDPGYFGWKIAILERYERAMLGLLEIERGLYAAKVARDESAGKLVSEAMAYIDDFETRKASIEAQLARGSATSKGTRNARLQAGVVRERLESANVKLSEAFRQSSVVEAVVAQQVERVEAISAWVEEAFARADTVDARRNEAAMEMESLDQAPK